MKTATRPLGPSSVAAQSKLPLAFLALSLVWLAAATAILAAAPEWLLLSHAAPAVVTLTHA